MNYNCEHCGHQFKQKIDLQRHLTKKNGCIPVNQIIEKKEQQSTMNGKIQELHSLFKTCLDVLRNDAEHLIGDEALNELSHFLILKQAEKHIENGSIDIYNLELYKDGVKKYGNEKFSEYLEYVKFSKLIDYVKILEKESNIKKIFDEFLWKEVLSKHPKFKDVFEDGKKSFIKESTTIKKIVISLSSIDFNNYDYDILGEAYESIFVDAVFGAGGNKKSELGQFFTPPKVKKLLVNLVNPKLKDNGEIESVLDPASGTGGILNTIIKHFKQFEKSNQITSEELRQQLIKNIYGIEIKGKIYNLCLSNMLINTGEILPNVICADSIRKFHNIKVDNIVANPPFSITINYDELLTSLGSLEILDDYIPIKTGGKNSEVLFLQMMIHCLNINGRCATVMLDGQKMYGSSSGYDKVREYLMKSCDLHEVILCPAGTFTSTASKTCILFFTKKKERKDVVEISGTKRILKFCKSHSTKKVKFYDFNPDTEEKHFIKEVEINEIASKKYSLNYTEYSIEEEENNDEEDIEWLELNSITEIQNGKRIVKKDILTGEYPVYGGGDISFYTDSYTREGKTCKISREGMSLHNCVLLLNTKYYLNSQGMTIITKNKDILNNEYLWYYLFVNKKIIFECGRGSGQKAIDMDKFKTIKLPIPSIEKQCKIVEFLDIISNKYNLQSVIEYYENNDIFRLLLDEKYDIFEKLVEWQDQSIELSKQIEFFKNRQTKYLYLVNQTENTLKTLSEICKINIGGTPRRDNPDYWNNGNNIWVSIRELNDNIITDSTEKITDIGVKESNVKLIPKDTILFSFKLSIGKIAISGCDLYTNEAIAGLIIQENQVIMKYLYYILKEINTFSSKGCIGGGSLNKDSLSKIKIPIPSLERQKEIVEYCEYNDTLIKQLEKEIENNKKQAQQFITGIVKAQVQTEEHTHTSSVNTELIDEVQNEIVSVEEEVIIEPKPKTKIIKKKVKKPLVIVEEDNEV
jgi:type I restriction-modification system DNA methylase subunit